MSEGASLGDVGRQFDRIAACYDSVAELPGQVADLMLARLQPLALTPCRVLDLGSGTGYCVDGLVQQYPGADVFAMDASLLMLAQQAQKQAGGAVTVVGGDCHHLPFQPGSFDLIVSNMVLHWCQDVAAVLRDTKALLSPGGVLVLTMAGPGTFHEWRDAWQSIDRCAHVLPFVAPPQLVQWLMAAGLSDVVVDSEHWVMAYQSLSDMHHAMKQAGASMPTPARQGLLGRRAYQDLCAAYEVYRDEAGYLPLSYDISLAYGRAPVHSPASSDQTSYVAVDQITRI